MTVRLSAEERVLLVDSLRRFLDDSWPVEGGVERATDPDALLRQSLALADLGLASIGSADGPGAGEAVLVFEELGRGACPVAPSGAIVANLLLDGADCDATRDFVAAVQSGTCVPAIALAHFDGDRSAGAASFVDGRVTASLQCVEEAAVATHVLVFTSAPFGLAVMARDSVTVTAEPGLAVPALSSVAIAASPIIWKPLDEQRLANAAQLVRMLCGARALGAAQRAFDLTVEHAKIRRQFGHVIGEFQAIQHKLVDCFSRLEGARLAFAGAADAFDHADPAWTVFADAALAFAGPALRQLALEVHHTLGAIGYAEEHEAPRHFRRIHADMVRFGGTARARAGLADYLLHPAA